MQKTQKSRNELKEQSSYIELPEMKNKKKECQEAEKQLRELEQKLGSHNKALKICFEIV